MFRLSVSAELDALFGYLPISGAGLVSGATASVVSLEGESIRLLT